MRDALLSDPDFRRLWGAGIVGHFVRWLEVVVFGIFTWDRTGSASTVALVLMLRLLPLALFGLPFGALAARIVRRTGLLTMLGLLAGTASALAAVALLGGLEVRHVALASFLAGTAWAADNPLRRAMMGEIAGPARMGRAMALDIGASNAARLAGPVVGGLLYAAGGMPGVLLPVAALYLLAIAWVLPLHARQASPGGAAPGLRSALTEGIRMARANPLLLGALWVTVVFNLFGWPVLGMVPVIGKERLGLAPDGVGLLAAADGLGTLVGTVALAALARPSAYGRLYVGGIALFLAMLPAFALIPHAPSAGLALFASGLGQAAFSVMQSTLVFVAAPPERRPQAMGLLTMAIGTGPIGFLMLGWLADRLGASWASAASATAGLAVLALTRPWWRACWEENGTGR